MRKTINILLGALIALLSGCKTQQVPAVQENRIMVMYGPPAYFQQKAQPNDTIQNNIEQNNTEQTQNS